MNLTFNALRTPRPFNALRARSKSTLGKKPSLSLPSALAASLPSSSRMGVTDCFRSRDHANRSDGSLTSEAADALSQTAQIVKDLSSKLDVDIIGRNFSRFAGGDELMDAEECVPPSTVNHMPPASQHD